MSKPKEQNWFLRHKFLSTLLFLFIFIGVVGSLSSQPSSVSDSIEAESEITEPEIQVTAVDLNAEYSANEVAADSKYEGKYIMVTGEIEDIAKDILDSMYVTLRTGELFNYVQCVLDDSQLERASTLNKGETITLRGKVSGSNLGVGVLVKKCEIQ